MFWVAGPVVFVCIACNCQFPHGRIWKKNFGTGSIETNLLVQICWRYFRDLAPRTRQTTGFLESPKQSPQQDSIHHWNWKRRSSTLPRHRHIQEDGWDSGPQGVPKAHTYNLYLQQNSHHPAQKQSILTSLIQSQSPLWWRLIITRTGVPIIGLQKQWI